MAKRIIGGTRHRGFTKRSLKRTGWKSGTAWPSAGPKAWATSVARPTNVWRKPKKKGFRVRTYKGGG